MVATIVLLMLLGWLACTAAMTIRAGAGSGIRNTEATGPLHVRRLTGAPASSGTFLRGQHMGDGES